MNAIYIHKLREVFRFFERELSFQNSESCCSGISLAQCHTLLEIEKNSKITVSELAGKLSLDKSTVSRTVDGLVNSQLVSRSIPSENRRVALISLTGIGKQACSAINITNDNYLREVLSDFSESEQEEFLRLFAKLTGEMAAYREAMQSSGKSPC